jgi:hypothetical protein
VIEFDLIRSLFHYIAKCLFDIDVELTRKRDAQRFLKKGRALLASGRHYEAAIQFSLALRLCPDIISSLSQSEQLQINAELERYRGESDAAHLRSRIGGKRQLNIF